MRSARFGLLPCLLLLLYIPLSAQQTPISVALGATDPQAVNQLQASLSALMGGTTSLPSTIVASGSVTPVWDNSAVPSAVTIYVQGTAKVRWEENLPGGTTAFVLNGTNAQSQIASTTTTLRPYEVAAKGLENFPIFLLSRWLSSGNVQLRFVGTEMIAGQTLNHVSVLDLSQRSSPRNPWHHDGSRGQYELYLDPASSLPVRLHYFQATSDDVLFSLLPVDLVYSNYQPTGGLVLPFTLTRYIKATEVSVIQLQSIQPNAAIRDQLFQIQ
jgi:hypothetical protein